MSTARSDSFLYSRPFLLKYVVWESILIYFILVLIIQCLYIFHFRLTIVAIYTDETHEDNILTNFEFSFLAFLWNYVCLLQCLIKKDRQDQNDPNMSEFFDKLNKAYNDPALMPIKYSGRFSSRRSPLLGSSESKTSSRESSSEDMINIV
jgi:hypothetical protein